MTSWPGKALPSKLYFPTMTPRPINRCVNSVSVKFDRMSISYCGIILNFFSLELYLVVIADGMVGAGVWCVPTLGSGALILSSTLGGTGVSTLGGTFCLAVRSTLVSEPGFYMRD